MIDSTQPVTYQEVYALKSQYLGKTKDLSYYRVLFLHGVDGKIAEQQNKIAEKDQDLTDFKKQRAYDVSFKFPPGLLAKVFFAVGTLLGITIAYNAYYRKSTRDQYKQEKAVFKQAIQTEVTKLNEMYKFRAETLTDNTNIPFHVWLNQAFVDKGSSTNERARAVLSELFHIQP